MDIQIKPKFLYKSSSSNIKTNITNKPEIYVPDDELKESMLREGTYNSLPNENIFH